MATTNNVQGDEPRPTALERQVQTLTAAVEHLAKWNQNIEEQLRQKNVPKKKIKKVPVLREETVKGRKVVTPQVDLSDKTRLVLPL